MGTPGSRPGFPRDAFRVNAAARRGPCARFRHCLAAVSGARLATRALPRDCRCGPSAAVSSRVPEWRRRGSPSIRSRCVLAESRPRPMGRPDGRGVADRGGPGRRQQALLIDGCMAGGRFPGLREATIGRLGTSGLGERLSRGRTPASSPLVERALEVQLTDHLGGSSSSAAFRERCGEPKSSRRTWRRPSRLLRPLDRRPQRRARQLPRRTAAEISLREVEAKRSLVTILGAEPYTG
jgi:hypothetical protein